MPTDPPQADPPQRKRRWFQFSLRTLLVVVTILAVQCAVCLPMYRQRQAEREIEKMIQELQADLDNYQGGLGAERCDSLK